MSQKIKTFSLYFIKRLFKKILFFSLLILFPNNFVLANENNPEDYFCEVSKSRLLEKDVISLSFKDKKFNQVISEIDKKPSDKKYNLLVSTGEKPSSGYSLDFLKIKKRKKFDKIYFQETKPKLFNLLLKFLFLISKISKFFFSVILLEILHSAALGSISLAWIIRLEQENKNKNEKINTLLINNLKSLCIK